MTLSTKILLGMVLGVALGAVLNILSASEDFFAANVIAWLVDSVFDVVGRIFVASLKLLVVPLVFVSLVCGASAMGVNARMGQMAVKTLGLYLLTTAAAVTLALAFANLIDPGMGIEMSTAANYEARPAPSVKEVLINIFPTNPIKAMAEGNMLQIIVFAILMGVAIIHSGDKGREVLSFFQSFNEVVMTMVSFLMHLAPYGVFCLLAKLFSELGISAIADLAKYFFTVVLVLLVHGLGVYMILFKLLTRLSPWTLLKNVRPAMLFAFSTSSSNATIPVTINVAERRIGIDNSIASFTVPLGATINMDGTAIMQGVATVFIAQAFNVDISLGGYIAVILTATLASIGTAGVPGVGLITLALVLQQVGLPVEGIALIIGVDRLLDMMRTAVNVTGDCVVSTIVARSENLLNEEVFNEVSDRDEYQAGKAD
ncbi:MAG: dicarboxylate/amino acid:cation symporter [Gammaproteobacteria bacterium]|nr:MAG: dicarboxylate/amino acid:cation symporter [Gammaproteobacteria bacterium]RLA54384.1 MAG: dicarboxylate/amino acid:cation symporter [Gammaproteobacteria bacterium]